MHFNIVTIFPEFFDSVLDVGLLGKAVESGLVTFERVTPRTCTTDRHQTVDDKPYGGGAGLVMMLEPLVKTLRGLKRPGRMLMLNPKGRPLTQEFASELAQEEDLTLICGRYEGIDERLLELFPIEPVCVGDFVLNGGETGALCVIESVSRLLPEFMHKEESHENDSFSQGLLEHPHYTRPDEFEGLAVPEVLTSGHHGKIEEWRHKQSLLATLRNRPDLLKTAKLSGHDIKFLRENSPVRLGRNLYLALVHHPVVNKFGDTVSVSLTNLDIHDMSRVSRTYETGGLFVVTPLEDQKKLAKSLLNHWLERGGKTANPDRAEALSKVRVAHDLEQAIREVEQIAGQRPEIICTSAQGSGRVSPDDVREMIAEKPVLLVFGTGHGLAPEVLEQADGLMRPIRPFDEYNHLSVRSAVSITVDRVLADTY